MIFTVTLIVAIFQHATAMNVNGQSVKGPLSYGETSNGLLAIAPNGVLSQTCNNSPPRLCGAITGGIMSGLYINSGARLDQDPESNLICGNYTVVTLDTNCHLSLDHQAQMRPNVDYGGGRIEVTSAGNACVYISFSTTIMCLLRSTAVRTGALVRRVT